MGLTRADRIIPASVLCIAALIVLYQQLAVSAINGWWADELFALWASDPELRFGVLLTERIGADSNPPLYFSLLAIIRMIGLPPRPAVVFLNVLCVVMASISVLWTARNNNRLWLGSAVVALFLTSASTVIFLQEARSYMIALSAVLVASWFAFLCIDRALAWPSLAVCGILCALTHLFAAIAACALAGGLCICGASRRQIALIGSGIALGASAVLTSAAWLFAWKVLGPGGFQQIGWIPFTRASVWEAFVGASVLSFGTLYVWAVVAIAVAFGLLSRRAFLATVSFIVALILFALVPIVLSFGVPMVIARYWAIGAPMVIVGICSIIAVGFSACRTAVSTWIGFAALFLAVLGIVSVGTRHGLHFIDREKPSWRVAPTIAELVRDCPRHAVHTLGFQPGFSIATGLSPDQFVDVRTLPQPTASPESSCPVLGWTEHYVLRFGEKFVGEASDADLLKLLKLDVSPEKVTIFRRKNGYVVCRKDACKSLS
jgi:hypothetical protein